MTTRKITRKAGTISGGEPTSVIGKLDESVRLTRFFGRLLSEATQLRVDTIRFHLQGDTLTAHLMKGEHHVKIINIKPTWFQPLSRWLVHRFRTTTGGSWVDESARGKRLTHFEGATRIDERGVAYIVDRRESGDHDKQIVLSGMEVYPLDRLVANLGVAPYCLRSFRSLIDSPKGIVVLTAPERENLKRTIASVLSLSDGHYLGKLHDTEVQNSLLELSQSELVFVCCESDDALGVLPEVYSALGSERAQQLIGVLCQGFLRLNCKTCGREAALDKKYIVDLPAFLRPSPSAKYTVGRGCPDCDQTGKNGYLGVQSVAPVDDNVRAMLRTGRSERELLDYLYPLGLRPLLTDGITKVMQGFSTFESLYGLTNTVPDVFASYAEQKKGGIVRADDEKELEVDVFTPEELAPRRSTSLQRSETQPGGWPPVTSEPLFSPEVLNDSTVVRVLVVEDDDDQRSILEMVLKSAGYEVTSASDGRVALETLAQMTPDLLITDLMMPRLDGRELVTAVRDDQRFARLPILILTVLGDDEHEYQLLELGADDYCDKTIQRKVLLKRIENLLKRSGVSIPGSQFPASP